ncbi:nephrin-like [Scyliorhinus torazame]|uniref:nephrin-like n=1 Tax=Scyliorhinus torazame TaxID=75743 RepID=UPI003B5C86B8
MISISKCAKNSIGQSTRSGDQQVMGSKPVMKAVYKSTGRLASSELTIMTVPSDNQAIYQCSATNVATPTPFTTITRIWVQFAPIDMRITASADQLHQGEILTLTCTVGSSNPVAQVTWIKDGVRMESNQVKIRNAEYGGHSIRAELSVIAMSSDDGQRVFCEGYCLILNEARNTFLRLNVLHAPEFLSSQVRIVLGHEHGAVIIPIEISANPSEVTYTWSKNGKLLIKDGPTRHHLRVDGSLEIWNLTRYDAGLYRIHVRNEEGGSERMLKLDVKYSPQISHVTDPAEVDVGGRIELICTADTNPVISNMVTWRRTGEGWEVSPSDQVFLNETTKLVIAGAKRGDAGSYECSADNGIPPVATARAQLIVRFKPEIQKGVDLSKVAVVGDGTSTATLNCKAEGIPDVEFYWAKHGVTLDPNYPRYLQTILHEGGLHTAELSVVNASAALDYATFTCTAQNSLGLDTFDIHLVSISRPDPPTGLSVLSKSHNSVTLAWNQGFNGGLEQTFQIRYTSAETLSYLYADVYPAQAMSFTITGLRAQTAYNFSVGALNTLGSSDYTDVLNVITSDQRQSFPTETLTILELKPAGGFLIPMPIFFPLLVLALLLLFLNVGIIAGLIHRVRQRGAGAGMGKSASPRVHQFELNDYCDEVVNVTSRQTLLIDTESELCSTTYESYDDSALPFEEAPGQRSRLRSTNDIIPRAFSCQEPAEWARRQVPNGPGYGVSNAERIFPNLPQEAGLKDQAIYEDVSDEIDLWPRHHTRCLEPNQHRMGSHPGMILSGAFPASFAAVSPLADYDEPSELWGELV